MNHLPLPARSAYNIGMQHTVRVVVFDLGGVMIRLADGWEGACRAAGVDYRPIEIDDDYMEAIAELETGIASDALTPEAYYLGVRGLVNGLYTTVEIRRIYQAVIQEEFPGIFEAVSALKATGYVTACLSNTCGPHWEDLTNPELYPAIALLDHQHASHLLRAAKPDQTIYQRFEEAVGAAPGEILFFDDNADNIAAARTRGWHAVHITPDRPSINQILDTLTSAEFGISCGRV